MLEKGILADTDQDHWIFNTKPCIYKPQGSYRICRASMAVCKIENTKQSYSEWQEAKIEQSKN